MSGKPVEIKSVAAEKAGRTYERSTVEFPYGDLDDAIEVAEAIHANAGTSCSLDQLAAFLEQSASSGAFRMKLSTARIFGLVNGTEKGNVELTELGRRIVDAGQRAGAASESFLCVALYRGIYEKYRGHMLPPAAALEREMASLGVAPKQASKARQAFERSAQQSGFFGHGKDRLVEPIVRNAPPPPPPALNPIVEERKRDAGGGKGGDGGGGDIHPAITGLLKTLPTAGSVWPKAERENWLTAVSSIFSLVYKEGDIR
ncbi:MAG: hypothetical protein ABW061_19365 [Polyangiaceae bacterium]